MSFASFHSSTAKVNMARPSPVYQRDDSPVTPILLKPLPRLTYSPTYRHITSSVSSLDSQYSVSLIGHCPSYTLPTSLISSLDSQYLVSPFIPNRHYTLSSSSSPSTIFEDEGWENQ